MVDMKTRTPIDLLPDRTAGTVATWLRGHPEIEVVCRDRAGAYAEGVRTGAPDAIQVADRWHLWHNLAGAVEKTVNRHRADLRPPTETTSTDDGTDKPSATLDPTESGLADGRLATRTRERHAAVHELLAQGRTISYISRTLPLDRKTVRRFARAADVHDLLPTTRTGRSLLDEYAPYLRERVAGGCVDAAVLTREITVFGYRGSTKTVRRFLQPLRAAHRTALEAGRPQRPSGHRVADPTTGPAHRRGPGRARRAPGAQPRTRHHRPTRPGLRRDHG